MSVEFSADLTELNKLEEYLRRNQVPYKRLDDEKGDKEWGCIDRHQIVVYEDPEKKLAII